MFKLVLQLSQAFIRDAHARRTLMFYGVIIALGLLFCGSTFLDSYLREHVIFFVGYWAICAWVTLFVVLLAVFDMLILRAAARAEKRRLAREILREDVDADR